MYRQVMVGEDGGEGISHGYKGRGGRIAVLRLIP